ncbi:MAG: J domain-containing protein [Planctomycetota bacterium]|nr:J domain-containing protein [Planctomycetota bacterium]MEC8338796.1 J domain-containing protein [Planctomycetota bacterium]
MAKDSGADRPEYMEVLGLSPPYAMEDVKKAYLDRVMQVHPDHGGSREDFTKLQEAFDLASKHLEIRVDRREWIADQVDSYVVMQDVVDVLHRLGAEVTTNALDWLEQSFGEFAQLTETILAVRLEDSEEGDTLIEALVKNPAIMVGMTRLELPGCNVSDASVLKLAKIKNLQQLDLSGTPVTKKCLELIDRLPELREMRLEKTRIGWWNHRKARAALKDRALPAVRLRTAGH